MTMQDLALLSVVGFALAFALAFLAYCSVALMIAKPRTEVAAKRFLELQPCPWCKASVRVEFLRHFQAYRCLCGQAFALDRTLSLEVESAIALFAEVRDGNLTDQEPLRALVRKYPHLGNMRTSSQRAYWLREVSAAKRLDVHGPMFVATRRQLAAAYEREEPLVEGKPVGYRDGEPTLPASVERWSGRVPRDGLLGADTLKIDATHIQFGTSRVPRTEAKFFCIEEKTDPLRYDLYCAYGAPLTFRRFVTIDEAALPKVEELIAEMEGVLGWLEVE